MPPTPAPTPGDAYKFTGTQLGERAETALKSGTVVTVREVVPASTAGAHNSTEDSVVIEWAEEGQTILSTRYEMRGAPVMAMAEDGSILTDPATGNPVYRLQSQEVPVHEFGIGQVDRAMSVSQAQFTTDFVKEA